MTHLPHALHYLLPADWPTFTLYLAAAVALYVWVRLYWTAGLVPGRRPVLAGAVLRVGTGFIGLTLAAQALQRQLTFATPWPLWSILLGGAGLVELTILLYQREQAALQPRRVRRLLTALRALLILALVFMLCQPELSWERARAVKRQVAVLLDTSASMRLPDNNAGPAEKIRLAYLLGLPDIPKPYELVGIKGIQRQLNAQADRLAALTNAADGVALAPLRRQGRALIQALEEALAEIARQTNAAAAIWSAPHSTLQSNLTQYSALLTTNARARLIRIREKTNAAMKDQQTTNAADKADLLARECRATAAGMAEMEPALAAIADTLDGALYASLGEQARDRVDRLADRNRLELAGMLLSEPARLDGDKPDILLKRLQTDYGMRLYTFAAHPEETPPEQLTNSVRRALARPITNSFGLSTDLAAALEQAAADTPADRLAGILLLTDGNHNASKPVEPILRRLSLKSVPVSAIIFGDTLKPPTDAAVASLEAPPAVSTNDRVNIAALLKLDGLAQTSLTVNLYRDNVLVGSQTVAPASPSFRTRIHLADTPYSNGLTMYRVTVPSVSNDVMPGNNSMDIPVYVTEDQTRVLMADGWPRWEFRYLKNVFSARDAAVRLQYIIFHPDQIDQAPPRARQPAAAGRPAEASEANAWPATPAEWLNFDVIILGDVERELLGDAELENLRQFVLTKGGTLVVVCGPMSMPSAFAETPLAEILPAVVPPPNPLLPFGGPAEEYRLMLTEEGRESPIMRLAMNPEHNLATWKSMPDLFWRHSLQELKPGATVLAYALPLVAPEYLRRAVPDAEDIQRRRQFEKENALIVVHQAGAGQVLFMAFDETWRFRYREGDLWHHKFWGQIQRWATANKLPFGSGAIRMGTDQRVYAPGVPARVRVRVNRPDNSPVPDVKLAVRCARRGAGPAAGESLRKMLEPEPGVPGAYVADLGALPEGRYDIALDLGQARELDGLAGGAVQGEFAVQPGAPAELINLAADRGLLRRIAEFTGGCAASPPQAREALEKLGAPVVTLVERRQCNLWTSRLLFCMLAAMAALEWVTRKRKGLP